MHEVSMPLNCVFKHFYEDESPAKNRFLKPEYCFCLSYLLKILPTSQINQDDIVLYAIDKNKIDIYL